jgi:DNA-binding HxlR family transcriptional regulator
MRKRSSCPAACALDIAGDKWTLLVVRDLLRGRSTYGALADSPERIPTNILADRLRRLEETGLVKAAPYQRRPLRYAYTLTEKGFGLEAVLASLARWGKRHIRGTRVMPEFSSSSHSSPRGRR